MQSKIENIDQLSIYLTDPELYGERIGEVILFDPLAPKVRFNEEGIPSLLRKSTVYHSLPWIRRVTLNTQVFFFKKFKRLVPFERKTLEAKFKTILAILLCQESLREFFLRSENRRASFFNVIQEAAISFGYKDFVLPTFLKDVSPLQISRELTWLNFSGGSLMDDVGELHLQIALLSNVERSELLFKILNNLPRPPIISVVEIGKKGSQSIEELMLTTIYGQYHICDIDKTGKIFLTTSLHKATSSIKTMTNIHPGAKGITNQRMAFAKIKNENSECVGCYSGELTCKRHVLEQIHFIHDLTSSKSYASNFLLHKEPSVPICDFPILFISLFSWREMEKIFRQYYAIHSLNGAIWQRVTNDGVSECFRLQLYYYNISLHNPMKLPAPGETRAVLQDLNDETLISLAFLGLIHLQKTCRDSSIISALESIIAELHLINNNVCALKEFNVDKKNSEDVLRNKYRLIDLVDMFRQKKKHWISILKELHNAKDGDPQLWTTLIALLEKKRPDGKQLKGVDELMYLSHFSKLISLFKTTNCELSIDKTAIANASDKAQFAFTHTAGHAFLPGISSHEELNLFKSLYSLYLIWEEPELTTVLSTGCGGESFFYNLIQKNSDANRYLIHWLKETDED